MSKEDKEPESAREIVEDTLKALDRGKRHYAEKTQQYGIAQDALQTLLKNVPDEQLDSYAAGFAKYRALVKDQENFQSVNVSSGALAMMGNATVAPSIGAVAFPVQWAVRAPTTWLDNSADYAEKLSKLDPELGRYFRGINEAFWGMTENQERVAFGLARQCFDHFFSLLAPDDSVRQSAFFKEKNDGPKPDAVSRMERLRFASSRIEDIPTAEFLAEQGKEFIETYGQLQELHARQRLDRDRARVVLQTFIAMMQQWVDALQL